MFIIIFLLTLIFVIVAAFILLPLFLSPRTSFSNSVANPRAATLLTKKEMIFQNIKDLDLEHQMGKLTDEDHQLLRENYKIEAAAVLEEMDRLQGKVELDQWIEDEVSQRRKTEDVQLASSLICPQCSHSNQSTAQFCSNCGFKLERASCPECESTYLIGEKFCNQCGYTLISSEEQNTE